MRTKLTAVFLLFIAPSLVFAAATHVGTKIISSRAVAHHDRRLTYSDKITLPVSQYHGLRLDTFPVTRSQYLKGSYLVRHVISNAGNGSDNFRLRLSGTTPGWRAALIRDSNARPVGSKIVLAENASYALFVVLTPPAKVKKGAKGETTLSVIGTVDDGGAYQGTNGVFYGGPDMVKSVDKVSVD